MEGDVAISEHRFMERFIPNDLESNTQLFDEMLRDYFSEYEKLGMYARRFENVDAFVNKYITPSEKRYDFSHIETVSFFTTGYSWKLI